MLELKDILAPALALLGTLTVAGIGLYQWRRQHGSPNRPAVAAARRQAAETLWAQLEEINIQLRGFGEDQRRISLQAELRGLNELFLRHSLYLDDGLQQQLRDYVTQLHAVARSIEDYQPDEEWSNTDIRPQRLMQYRGISRQLERMVESRARIKVALRAAAEEG